MWYTLTSNDALSKGFQILLALKSGRALSAVLHPGQSVTSADRRSNGSVITFLHSALTNSFVISDFDRHPTESHDVNECKIIPTS